MDWKLIWKAAKEPLRLLVLALIPFALVYLETISAEWAVVLLFVLRFVDKWMHEAGKAKSTARVESKLVKGLTRF